MIDIHRMVLATDWPAVRDIYADGLATGLAAFLSNPPSQNEWDRAHLPFDRLVARLGDAVHGWQPSPLLPTREGRPASLRSASMWMRQRRGWASAARSSEN